MNTIVFDDEELFIAARIIERRRVDLQCACLLAGALAVQAQRDVNLAARTEWRGAALRDARVVATVARALEDDHLVVGALDVEDVDEAGVDLAELAVCKQRHHADVIDNK